MNPLVLKRCFRCKLEKQLNAFSKEKMSKDGLHTYCKECDCIRGQIRKEKNRTKNLAIGETISHKECPHCKIDLLANCFSKCTTREDGLQRTCKDCVSRYNKTWYAIPKNRKTSTIRDKKRRETNLNTKLAIRLRIRLCVAIIRGYKAGSAVKDLGCSIEEFKLYIQSKFRPGMTWKNWGRYGWHLDHIKPLSSFNLAIRDQFLIACHYTNIQPLWAKENLTKHDSLSWPVKC